MSYIQPYLDDFFFPLGAFIELKLAGAMRDPSVPCNVVARTELLRAYFTRMVILLDMFPLKIHCAREPFHKVLFVCGLVRLPMQCNVPGEQGGL